MLLLPLRANRLSACGVRTRSAPERLHREVTDIFTTALPMRASAIELARWGTNDIGVFVVVSASKGPAFHRATYPISSPPASVEPQRCGKPF
ncbi:hypothetical protein H8B02_39995 [Bradyrhizobium sp. Pear77]|uniref:hypothetical protein n=1 Tax=Bradyrhizobium altum TaxID=1571202 RepID=UPI001E369C84|nr:hypothetical protein [Bradyrhizobium altum]MCC8959367.1 hypothetical protein [Bradyrhizobium altum]